MRIELTFPKLMRVSDYHEFRNLEYYLQQMSKQIKVKEIAHVGGEYVGIVYIGNLKDPPNAHMIRNVQERARKE